MHCIPTPNLKPPPLRNNETHKTNRALKIIFFGILIGSIKESKGTSRTRNTSNLPSPHSPPQPPPCFGALLSKTPCVSKPWHQSRAPIRSTGHPAWAPIARLFSKGSDTCFGFGMLCLGAWVLSFAAEGVSEYLLHDNVRFAKFFKGRPRRSKRSVRSNHQLTEHDDSTSSALACPDDAKK